MLTATSEYALRALVKLAQLPGEEMTLGQTLSAQCRIPANYLSKLMLVLRNSGLVEAVRSSRGGYRLGKPAHDISIFEVAGLFEDVKSETKCLLGEDHDCSDEEACSAHIKFRRVRLAYIDFLTTTTIASIAKKKPVKKTRNGQRMPFTTRIMSKGIGTMNKWSEKARWTSFGRAGASLAFMVLLAAMSANAQETAAYFQQNCTSCHTIGGARLTAPDLKDVTERRDREWLKSYILNPQARMDAGDPYALQLLDEAQGL